MKLEAKQTHLTLGDKTVLNGVDLTASPGSLLGLIGPNGAGKSSLLKVLAGLQQPDRGQILLDGESLQSIDRRRRAAQVAYLAQGAPAHWAISVHRLVELGRLPHLGPWARLQERDIRAVEQAMALADVDYLASRRMNTLSTGERVRVLVARLLAVEPTLILADEPIAALDPLHQLQIMNVLKTHCARGGTAVVVLHDLALAARFCAELALLHQGRSVLQGRPDVVLTTENLMDVYGVEARFASIEDQLYVVPWAPISTV